MNNILIVLLGALGDVTRGFSVLKPIKSHYPDVKITWLVEPRCKGIVSLHGLVDEIIVFDRNNPASGLVNLAKQLKERKFDVTLDLQRHLKSGFFSFLSGARKRVGFNKKNAKEFNWLFNTDYIPPVSKQVSKVYHYEEFLKVINVPKPEKPDFGIEVTDSDIPFDIIDNCTPDRKFANNIEGRIGLVLGSQWPSKDWPEYHYHYLISKLKDNLPNYEIVLIGDPSLVPIADRIVDRANDNPMLCNTVGKTNLRQLLGVLSICSLVVGPDSGPGHIAASMNVKYITLFGPTEIARVVPFGCEDYIVFAGLNCSPCMKRNCPGLDKSCMQLVTPDMVISKINEVLTNDI